MKHRNRKHITCLISIVLVIVMLFTGILPVFAVTITTDKEELTGADIVSEDVSKREEFVKHYLTGDGTYFAVSYAEQVHYLDDNGNWKEVDNTISTNILTGEKSTKNDKFKVKFANKANKDKLVSIQTDEFKVSWGLSVSEDGTVFSALNKVKGIENEALKPKDIKTTTDAQSLGKAVSGIIYEDAFGDYLDVRYSVAYQKIKEDLILNEKSEFTSYKVTYNVNNIKGAYAVLDDNGEVTFYDENDTALFKAGLPVMYDAAGDASGDIDVQVTQSKKTIEVVYTPSSEWLSDDERVYPVTIDPSVQSSQYTSNIMDTSHYPAYGGGGSPTNVLAVFDKLYIGTDYYTCIKFHTVPSISDELIIGTNLILYSGYFPENVSTDNYSMVAANITQYWNEYMFESNEPDFVYDPNITYFNSQFWVPKDSEVQNPDPLERLSDSLIRITLDISPIYNNNGGYNSYFSSYYGFYVDDHISSYFDFWVYSSEYVNTTYRPCITINYSGQEIDDSLLYNDIPQDQFYRLKNIATGKYLSIGKIGYNTLCNESNISVDQNVRFLYDSQTQTYKIKSLKNSNYAKVIFDIANQPTYYVQNSNVGENWRVYKMGTDDTGNPIIRIVKDDLFYSLTSITMNNQEIAMITPNGLYSSQDWILIPSYTEISISYNTLDMNVDINEKVQLISSIFTSFESENESIADIDSNGVLTAKAVGKTTINAYTLSGYTFNFDLYVTIPDGTYYISDVQNRLMLSYNQPDTSVPECRLFPITGANTQKWNINYKSEGHYYITCTVSNTFYLAAYNNGIILTDNEDNYGDSSLLWSINTSSRGNLTLKPMCYDSLYLYNKTESVVSSSIDAHFAELCEYTDDSDLSDEWNIFQKADAIMLAYNEFTGNVKNTYNEVENQISGAVYTNYYFDLQKEEIISMLQSTEIMIIFTHGNVDGIQLSLSKWLTSSEIANKDFSNLKLVLLISCSTAEGSDYTNYPQNFLETLSNCGAETVIGFNRRIPVYFGIEFLSAFSTLYFQNKKSVSDALFEINSDYVVAKGNLNQTYN